MSEPARREGALHQARVRDAWLLLAPMLTVLGIVAGWPLLRTIWLSFTDARLGPGAHRFVGFENYLWRFDGFWDGVLADPVWWQSVWNTLWFAGVSVGIETVLGTIVALTLAARFPGRALYRAVVLVPWAVPTVVSARIWAWMLHDQYGVVNDALLRLGAVSAPVAWIARADTALWAAVLVDVWKTTPFVALLVLAGLQMLPRDIYEAARVDGVHPVRVFFRITLPLLRPAILVAVVFRALDALRVFDLLYVLTSAADDTMSMSIYARRELVEFQDAGWGSAAATLVFLVIALPTAMLLTAGRLRLPGAAR